MGKLTKQQQQMILMLFIFVIGGGYIYWNKLLMPTLRNIETREAKYKELLDKIETAERQARRLPALQNELAQLQSDLSDLEKQLPKDKDVPNIIRTLTKEAMQENLEFSRFIPKAAIRQQYFEILPFELQFTGDLHSLARFLASLGQQERIFQAQNVQLSAGGGSFADGIAGLLLSINLTIQTYAYAG